MGRLILTTAWQEAAAANAIFQVTSTEGAIMSVSELMPSSDDGFVVEPLAFNFFEFRDNKKLWLRAHHSTASAYIQGA